MSSLIGKAVSNSSSAPAANPVALERRSGQTVQVGSSSAVTEVRQTIRRDLSKTFIQSISAGSNSELKDNTQNVVVNTVESTFYFDLTLLEVVLDEIGMETLIEIFPQTALKPATTYAVRVSYNLTAYPEVDGPVWKMRQYDVKTRGTLLFWIEEASGGQEGAITTLEGQTEFTPNEADDWGYEFRITTKVSYSIHSTFLRLMYRSGQSIRPATQLEVVLEKNVDQTSSPNLLPCYLPHKAEPPEKTAVLHILPDGKNQLKFVGWVRDLKDRPSNLNPIIFPQIVSEDYEEEVDYLNAIWEKFSDFASTDPGNIAQWFEAVLSLYKNDCCFIIVDQTEAQLPWEMFSLKDGRCLGATAAIVRWTNEEYYGQAMMLQLNNVEYTGHVAAYVHSPETSLSALNDLVSQYCSAPSELQYQLATTEGNSSAGLVYLSHIDIVTYGDEQSAIAQFRNPSGKTVKMRFDHVKGKVKQRPIFFINSPYSGRILWSGQQSCGLVKAVLGQVGAGYIGTLAPIPSDFAIQVANAFLKRASSQGVRPAYFLSELRAHTWKRYEEVMTKPELREKAWLRFLYSLMYIYYGNPQALLKVVPTQSTFS